MDGNNGANCAPHIENVDVIVAIADEIDPKMNDTSRVMETSPLVLGDKRMRCDIMDDLILLDIVIG